MTKRQAFTALLAAGLTGCDYTSFVIREAPAASMPTPDQVLAAVRGTPGVDSAAYVADGFTGHPVPADSAIVVTWDGTAGKSGFVTFERRSGGVRYEQRVGYLGGSPAQREVDAAYPMMLAVEEQLQAVPGLGGLRRTATHVCSRDITCPPAAAR